MGGYFTSQHGAHRGSNGSSNDADNIDRLITIARYSTLALTHMAREFVVVLEQGDDVATRQMRLCEILNTEEELLERQSKVIMCSVNSVFINEKADDLPTDYFCEACVIHTNQIGFEFEKLNVLLRRDICSFNHYAKQMISLSMLLLNQNPWLSGKEPMSSSRVGNEKTIIDTEEEVGYIVLD